VTDRDHTGEAGFDHYLFKPIDYDTLVNCLYSGLLAALTIGWLQCSRYRVPRSSCPAGRDTADHEVISS
jgi:hypothetical protein